MTKRGNSAHSPRILITGGAGFVGTNLAKRLAGEGAQVRVLDTLARSGSEQNIAWLGARFPNEIEFLRGDIRNVEAVRSALDGIDHVYHLAAQVAVTTSLADPRADFDVNAGGTLNLLEAVRECVNPPSLLYASTNKVYGGMETIAVVEDTSKYRYRDLPDGIPEDQLLDFHSPYGCSKGAGDQYVRDYARIYGLRTVVMRQSCIYGTRQFGVEDQGWVAHFCISARLGRPITIYGDGKQARDVLWIDDLVAAYRAATERIEVAAGNIYNVGGGPANTVSIWCDFEPRLERLAGHPIAAVHGPWRPGDQPVYVSDVRKAERDLGWRPRTSFDEGLDRLWKWVDTNPHLFDTFAVSKAG